MPEYTKEDFLKTTKPYEYLQYLKEDPTQHEQALLAVQENARAVGVRNFRKIYASYIASL